MKRYSLPISELVTIENLHSAFVEYGVVHQVDGDANELCIGEEEVLDSRTVPSFLLKK